MGGGQAAARGKDARTSAALLGKHSSGAGFVGAPTVTELMPAHRRISSNRPVSAHAVAAPATAAGAIMVDVSKKAAYLLCAAVLALGQFNMAGARPATRRPQPRIIAPDLGDDLDDAFAVASA